LPNVTSEHVFENAFTLDKDSWGWNRRSNATNYLTTKEVLDTLVKTISRNGNVNVNVGPGADGTISPIMVDRLLAMGEWLSVNGEGVYGTTPWKVCNQDFDGKVVYTRSKDVLYAHLMEWPAGNKIHLSCPERTVSTVARMLGLKTNNSEDYYAIETTSKVRSSLPGMTIKLPALTPDVIPCQHVWVIAIRGVGNLDGEAATKKRESANE
jgi:alpha-L-fucosidase